MSPPVCSLKSLLFNDTQKHRVPVLTKIWHFWWSPSFILPFCAKIFHPFCLLTRAPPFEMSPKQEGLKSPPCEMKPHVWKTLFSSQKKSLPFVSPLVVKTPSWNSSVPFSSFDVFSSPKVLLPGLPFFFSAHLPCVSTKRSTIPVCCPNPFLWPYKTPPFVGHIYTRHNKLFLERPKNPTFPWNHIPPELCQPCLVCPNPFFGTMSLGNYHKGTFFN